MFGKKSAEIRRLKQELSYQTNRADVYEREAARALDVAETLKGRRDNLQRQLTQEQQRYACLKGKYNKLKAGIEQLRKV